MIWDGRPAVTRARGTASVPVSASSSGSIAVTYPAEFATVPTTIATPVGSSVFMPSVFSPTTTGFVLTIRHIDAASLTATVPVNWIADGS